jgi:GTPase
MIDFQSLSEPTLAIVIHFETGRERLHTPGGLTREQLLGEAVQLVESAGHKVVATLTGQRDRPDPGTFLGAGKVEEVAGLVKHHGAGLVVFNQPVGAVQARNLEKALGARVIDRTELILDIFAQRAQSHEGKLQVELARLQHASTRLVRGWTHLERQRGGIGLRGGMGESQLEIDRRLLGERVKLTRERLAKVTRQRATQRARRNRNEQFRVVIVGYTNAGKSTLFNRLTRAGTLVADQLFATLDTTTRKLHVGDGTVVAISDTVGFIRDLPHSLVDAFKATLEEAVQADLLLHVYDASNPTSDDQIYRVNQVLTEIGAAEVPQLMVANKVDCCKPTADGALEDGHDRILGVRVSATQGLGLADLRAAIAGLVAQKSLASVAGGTPLADHTAATDALPDVAGSRSAA